MEHRAGIKASSDEEDFSDSDLLSSGDEIVDSAELEGMESVEAEMEEGEEELEVPKEKTKKTDK